ncbi:peptidase [Sphaerisporangium krabiense]|uniref:Pimeloyl-ACP methyl ester carboxylesterase n=1 Tax=Sphaerisporangium krabiense TaxID=763782 RepID=A0A7W8Z8D7_9ACTN|nr:alpha/beta hydrolase [Sphaerisporangium krabiense]MBB5629326.1 pimeloyl-ACP methyl ester carboxylesterase [Sphaerisporangium krabiense]GII67101.1 peptidase [Sphaerisporangium krabiense]
MKRTLTASLLALAAVLPVTLGGRTAAAADAPISWRQCGDRPGAECGSLEVPLDWTHPTGATIKLSVTRRKAADPAARVGTLFYNPGGPGGQAVLIVRDYPSTAFSAELLRRFDVVGVDPRGVGESQAVRCGLPVHDPEVSAYPDTPAGYEALVAHNKAVGESCLAETGPLLRHIGTMSVARDFDAVRAALGETKITFLGKSYGTILGTRYAQLFPDRIRAMALDGAVDHGMGSRRLVTDATRAVEDSFERFAAWCDRTDSCALHGRDVGRVWDDLVARAEREPIPVKDGRPLTAEELRYVAYAFLTMVPEFAGGLATALTQAEQGDASILASMRGQALDDPASTAAYRSVLCLDIDPEIHGYRDLRARLKKVRALSPHMKGTSEFWDMTTGCLGWPVPPADPQRPVDVHGAPPILVVGTTHDPATPAGWARSLSSHISGSGLLTYDGTGHTAYLRSACATGHVDRYLLTGRLPARGTVCEAGR